MPSMSSALGRTRSEGGIEEEGEREGEQERWREGKDEGREKGRERRKENGCLKNRKEGLSNL